VLAWRKSRKARGAMWVVSLRPASRTAFLTSIGRLWLLTLPRCMPGTRWPIQNWARPPKSRRSANTWPNGGRGRAKSRPNATGCQNSSKEVFVSDAIMKAPEALAPHSVEAEEAVLGSLLIDPDALDEIRPVLFPTDFYILRHGWIYESLLAIQD